MSRSCRNLAALALGSEAAAVAVGALGAAWLRTAPLSLGMGFLAGGAAGVETALAETALWLAWPLCFLVGALATSPGVRARATQALAACASLTLTLVLSFAVVLRQASPSFSTTPSLAVLLGAITFVLPTLVCAASLGWGAAVCCDSLWAAQVGAAVLTVARLVARFQVEGLGHVPDRLLLWLDPSGIDALQWHLKRWNTARLQDAHGTVDVALIAQRGCWVVGSVTLAILAHRLTRASSPERRRPVGLSALTVCLSIGGGVAGMLLALCSGDGHSAYG